MIRRVFESRWLFAFYVAGALLCIPFMLMLGPVRAPLATETVSGYSCANGTTTGCTSAPAAKTPNP